MGDEDFAVSREQMTDLRVLISSVKGNQAAELKRWTARVLRRPAWQVLGPINELHAVKLAARLGKAVTFDLRGGDTTVDVESVRPVFQVLTHLIRNAGDHGIVGPTERSDKPLTGRLEFEIADRPTSYVLRCADDGRGIDLDALTKRAVDLGFVTADALRNMNDRDKLDLIFIEGLSTALVTTSISGRGVGMSAVRAAVDRVGGKIDIRSTKGAGTTFVLTIPKDDESSSAVTDSAVS